MCVRGPDGDGLGALCLVVVSSPTSPEAASRPACRSDNHRRHLQLANGLACLARIPPVRLLFLSAAPAWHLAPFRLPRPPPHRAHVCVHVACLGTLARQERGQAPALLCSAVASTTPRRSFVPLLVIVLVLVLILTQRDRPLACMLVDDWLQPRNEQQGALGPPPFARQPSPLESRLANSTRASGFYRRARGYALLWGVLPCHWPATPLPRLVFFSPRNEWSRCLFQNHLPLSTRAPALGTLCYSTILAAACGASKPSLLSLPSCG